MDIIYIRGLEIETVIGIFDWEQKITQTVCLDLEFSADIEKSAQTDRIEDTLDYKKICKRIIAFVEESRFQLVETLAQRIAELVLDEFEVQWLRLKLGKPGALRGSRDVGVLIERGKHT